MGLGGLMLRSGDEESAAACCTVATGASAGASSASPLVVDKISCVVTSRLGRREGMTRSLFVGGGPAAPGRPAGGGLVTETEPIVDALHMPKQ